MSGYKLVSMFMKKTATEHAQLIVRKRDVEFFKSKGAVMSIKDFAKPKPKVETKVKK